MDRRFRWAVVLAALLWFTDPREIWQSLSRADLKWVALAVAINIATVPVMAWRWQLLLAAKRLQVPLGWLTRTYFVALFIGQFLPAAVGGDAVRAVELGRGRRAAIAARSPPARAGHGADRSRRDCGDFRSPLLHFHVGKAILARGGEYSLRFGRWHRCALDSGDESEPLGVDRLYCAIRSGHAQWRGAGQLDQPTTPEC